MAKKSLPQIRRELRGIKQDIDPLKAQAGRKGAVVTNAKRANISIDEALKSEHFKKLARASNSSQAMGGKHADELIASELRYAAKNVNKQATSNENINNIFVENSTFVSEKLVEMALGQNDFHDAPASVQRLAMLDVLTLAGIDSKQAEKQAKDVKDMTRAELEAFLRATASIVEKVNSEQPDN